MKLSKRIAAWFKSDAFQAYVEGYSMAFDWWPQPPDGYPYDTIGDAIRADWEAVLGDLETVLSDINHAMEQIREEDSNAGGDDAR